MKVYGAVRDVVIQAKKCSTKALIESGFAGVHAELGVVDRREHPDAVPVEENKMLGSPAPKTLEARN